MAEGIRINDAALEISPEGLEALVQKRGAEIRLTKVDLSVSPEAVNTLLQGLAPEGAQAPVALFGDGSLRVQSGGEGRSFALDLSLGGMRLEISPAGLRLTSE